MDIDRDTGFYRQLLESTKAIPWEIDWVTKRFTYIGPRVEEILGWPEESWATIEDWVARIHPEDRTRVLNYCLAQSIAGLDHEADYRAQTKQGDYVWIRDIVNVVRKDGTVTSLVGFMFDITERKRMEQEVFRLNEKLERLAQFDALTGVANRRTFNETLDREWARCMTNQRPISLLLLDVDYFKQYNDHYGHQEGDRCLQTLAKALRGAVNRSADLVSRYGGEEFAILLPDTGSDEALLLAERARAVVLDLKIAHAQSVADDVVTISIGVSTIVPAIQTAPSLLIDRADEMLYRAKDGGRNRVVDG